VPNDAAYLSLVRSPFPGTSKNLRAKRARIAIAEFQSQCLSLRQHPLPSILPSLRSPSFCFKVEEKEEGDETTLAMVMKTTTKEAKEVLVLISWEEALIVGVKTMWILTP